MGPKAIFIINYRNRDPENLNNTLLISKLLLNRGWKVELISEEKEIFEKVNNFIPTNYLRSPVINRFSSLLRGLRATNTFESYMKYHNPIFLEYNSYNYKVLEHGYENSKRIISLFRQIEKIVNRMKPDILFGDGSFLTFFIGKKYQIPIIQIVNHVTFPENSHLIWWKRAPNVLIPPRSTEIFLPLFLMIKEEPVVEAIKMLQGNAYLIPGTDDFIPVKTKAPFCHYGINFGSEWDNRLLRIDRKKRKKKVLVKIKKNDNKLRIENVIKKLLEALIKYDAQIIFSNPQHILEPYISEFRNNNIEVFNWVKSPGVFPVLDLVIHFGEICDCFEAVYWGTPQIIIPSQTEQESLARITKNLILGEFLFFAKQPLRLGKIPHTFGQYTINYGCEEDKDNFKIFETIDKVIGSKKYLHRISEVQNKLYINFNEDKISSFINNSF